jgi:hypothetical protein
MMPRPRRISVIEAMLDTGLIASLGDAGPEEVVAAWAGGARAVELRHTGRSSVDRFRVLHEGVRGPFMGVSGVAEPAAVQEYLELGADFVSAPLDPELARICHQSQAAYLPDVNEADQVRKALGLGTDIVIGLGDKTLLDSCATYFVRLTPMAARDEIDHWIGLGARGVVVPVESVSTTGTALDALPVSRWVRAALNEPLFGPVEHIGLYPPEESDRDTVAAWYQSTFGFPATHAKTTYVGSGILGRIEVMPGPVGEAPHVAISVRDFDEAVSDLRSRGHLVKEPVVTPNAKLAYLEERDPSGCLVHLIWRPRRFAS